jgi:DNA-binding response OmpR family regulator
MQELKSILVFGADAMLLDTRRRVLESAGFGVTSSTTLQETERALREQTAALLLLCPTLSTEDCERAIALAHAVNRSIVTLALATTSSPCTVKSDVVVDSMSGPKKLVETVQTILH